MRPHPPRRIVAVLTGFAFMAGCADRAETPLAPTSDGSDGNIRPPAVDPGGLPFDDDDHGWRSGGVARGELVVRVTGGDASALADLYSTTTLRSLDDDYVLVAVPADARASDLAATMPGTAGCVDAQLNYLAESPESEQGAVAFYEGDAIASDVIDQEALARIGLGEIRRWIDGSGVLVAIVDTGIDSTHPDLAAAISPLGWDFVDDDAYPMDEVRGLDRDRDGLVDEAAGHGTHVAGIVHAIAPGAMIMPVRVLDPEGIGTAAAVAQGIRWAVDQGADVINLSLGLSTESRVIRDAVLHAILEEGVFVTTSAGNHGAHVEQHYPAKYDDVLTVAAIGPDDLRASFTTYGDFVEVSAPGVGILSTYLNDGYASWSGTSMAAPMAAGAAALYIDRRWGRASPERVRERIEESARSFATTSGIYGDELMGDGILDLEELLD